MRRSLAFAVLNFMIGIVLMYFSIDLGIVYTALYLGILALIYKAFFELKIRYFFFTLLGCILMLLSILGHYNAERMPFVSREAICRGYISAESIDKFGMPVYECEVKEVIFNSKIYNQQVYKVKLSTKEKCRYSMIGERVNFRAKLNIPEANDDKRNYRRYLYSKGIDYKASCRKLEISKVGVYDSAKIRFTVIKFINDKKNLFLANLDSHSRGYFAGIIFGEKNLIDSEIIDEFQGNGTAHILAVSGLHIGIIYMVYKWVKTRFKLGNSTDIILVLMLIIYVILASFSVSIIRAVLIILLKIIADKMVMRFDFLTAISTALLVSLLLNPYSIFDMGFQLSFLSALIIDFIFPHIRRTKHERILGIMALPICLGAYNIVCFGRFSLIAVLANSPVIFLMSIYVPLGIVSFFTYFMSDYFPKILSILITTLGDITYTVNHSFNILQRGVIEVEYNNVKLVFMLYAFIFFVASEYFYINVVSRHNPKPCIGFIIASLIAVTI